MNKHLLLFKTLRKDITILFFSCILIIIIIDFYLKNIPEYFTGGAKIGDIVEKLCLSYISAFIFYFLVVHIKAQKDKLNIYKYISKKINMVVGSCQGLVNEMAGAANIVISDTYPTQHQLTCICQAINPNSNSPMLLSNNGNYANWVQYINYQKERSNEAMEKIFSKMPFLDTKLVNLLANIDDCSFFYMSKVMMGIIPMPNTNMLVFQDTLFNYLNLIQELENYAKKNIGKYYS